MGIVAVRAPRRFWPQVLFLFSAPSGRSGKRHCSQGIGQDSKGMMTQQHLEVLSCLEMLHKLGTSWLWTPGTPKTHGRLALWPWASRSEIEYLQRSIGYEIRDSRSHYTREGSRRGQTPRSVQCDSGVMFHQTPSGAPRPGC